MSDISAGKLTTHALDTRLGQPARNLAFTLFRLDGADRHPLCAGRTNDDGRAGQPLLEGDALKVGIYELVFGVGDYQAALSDGGAPGFYDVIPIRFRVIDTNSHYHIPLLLSPFGYSTYRGS